MAGGGWPNSLVGPQDGWTSSESRQRLPKRSNLFQNLVATIHQHMAGDATVEESSMLTDKVTGDQREVDVVIRSRVAQHDIVVSVEATAGGRRATVTWVEGMLRKHQDLPSDKLVLVSAAGFTKAARSKAEASDAVVWEPVDLGSGDPVYTIVNKLKSIWPKTVSLTPQKGRVWVKQPDGEVVFFQAPEDLDIFLDNGEYLGTLVECITEALRRSFSKIMEDIDLAMIGEDRDQFFSLTIEPWRVKVGGQEVRLCVRFDPDGNNAELHPIERLEVIGRAVIKVAKLDLTHQRLGDVAYAYGEAEMGDARTLFVLSESETGSRLTIRPLEAPGGSD